MLILLKQLWLMFGGSRYEGTITAKDHQMQKFVDGQKMGMGQVTATFPKQSFKC
jgi:hypothetical protein